MRNPRLRYNLTPWEAGFTFEPVALKTDFNTFLTDITNMYGGFEASNGFVVKAGYGVTDIDLEKKVIFFGTKKKISGTVRITNLKSNRLRDKYMVAITRALCEVAEHHRENDRSFRNFRTEPEVIGVELLTLLTAIPAARKPVAKPVSGNKYFGNRKITVYTG